MAVAAANRYLGLNRASISYDYLHTNSTTHEFLFGAIVELVDNSRDADAKKMEIDCVRDSRFIGDYLLTFLDDGMGMDRQEAIGVMTFGYSAKRLDPNMIGQYGNGLKSGAMRIGKDFILFTKRSEVLTCVFLSRSFHEKERLQEVIVPVPSFTTDKKPLVEDDEQRKRHDQEMAIIYEHSPFANEQQLFAQFDRIAGKSGTLVICFNMRLLENGATELDFASDLADIRLTNPVDKEREVPEKESLKAYLAIVYANPHMKVYIKGKKVATHRVISSLYRPKQYKYLAKNFRARAAKELERGKHDVISAKEKLKMATSERTAFQQRHMANYAKDAVLRAQFRQLENAEQTAKKQLKDAEERCKVAEKSKNDPKPLTFTFGLNLQRRGHCGCMIYNNGRLIRMYEQVGPQKDGGIKCLGVIGVVDVPYVVLEPTHNKQSFADNKEYQALLRALGEHMDQYWTDLDLAVKPGGVPKFWDNFGYKTNDWALAPLMDKDHVLRRNLSVKMAVQCEKCLKWRMLDYQKRFIDNPIADDWNCAMHSNALYQKCSTPEEVVRLPEGKLLRRSTMDDEEALARKADKLAKEQHKVEQSRAKLASGRGSQRLAGQATPPSQQLAKARKGMISSQQPRESSASSSSPEPSNRRNGLRQSPSPAHRPKTKAEQRKAIEERERKQRLAEEATARKRAAERLQKQVAERKRKQEEERKRAEAEKRRLAARKAISGRQSASIVDDEEEESDEEHIGEDVSLSAAPAGRIPRAAASRANDFLVGSRRRQVRMHVDSNHCHMQQLQESASPHVNSTTTDCVPAKKVKVSATKADAQSTTGPVSAEEKVEKLASTLRKCFIFFMPPKYKITKEDISAMSSEDLITKVDIREFQEAYENGLRDMIGIHREQARTANDALARLRRDAAELLDQYHPSTGFMDSFDPKSDLVDRRLHEFIQQSK